MSPPQFADFSGALIGIHLTELLGLISYIPIKPGTRTAEHQETTN